MQAQRGRGRQVWWLAALAVLGAAACGDDGGRVANDGPGNADVATGGRLFATADVETAKLGTDVEPGTFPRTVVHALGETVLEARPERVVVLDTGELDDVVTLDVTPVGVAYTDGSPTAPEYLDIDVSDVPSVGATNQINLEAIAALKPDLILGSQLRAEDLYPQLSEIAPTVFSIRPGFPWKENFLLVADALGTEDRAVEVLNAYQERADAVAATVEGDPTVSIVRFRPDDLRLYGNRSFIGVILQDVGLARPALQDIDDLAVEISPENITDAGGDLLFYSSYGDPSSTDEASIVGGALWNSIDAVKAGNDQRVDDELWFLALGPTGAMALLDELEGFLAA